MTDFIADALFDITPESEEPKAKLLPTPNTMDTLPVRTGEALDRARRRGRQSNPSTLSNLREVVVHEMGL